MLKSPPLVATLSDSMRMSPCSWGDIFTWPLRGDRIIGLRHTRWSGFTEMADFFTLNSYVECERTILAKSDREPGGAGIRRGQHARRGARGKIRGRRGVSQRGGRPVSDDRAADHHAQREIHALVGRGLPEISAD